MSRALLVGLAGALGTLARYGVGVWAGKALGPDFPYGTFIVNVVGCFLIALVAEVAAKTALISPDVRIILTTGFVGGLTTYSSFNFETTKLLRQGHWLAGLGNVGLTLGTCFVAGLLGLALADRIASS